MGRFLVDRGAARLVAAAHHVARAGVASHAEVVAGTADTAWLDRTGTSGGPDPDPTSGNPTTSPQDPDPKPSATKPPSDPDPSPSETCDRFLWWCT